MGRTIENCAKMQGKFAQGTSQHSLLKNRIRALEISKCLLAGEGVDAWTREDLERAAAPIASIIHKTTKARSKYEAGSVTYKRFTPTIDAMTLCQELLEEKLGRRNGAV